ncbi:TPA: hypothetical protein DDZ86_00605 [Candidatus Dependentiae bacterium]|nr:MAG: hypothetical protein UW09_C0002G0007 [candidate division TM6 bacterium GW2011_GWF2_43_87]HBL98124.1 hypothetical protein [Candidatus Dependentiae bacterium]
MICIIFCEKAMHRLLLGIIALFGMTTMLSVWAVEEGGNNNCLYCDGVYGVDGGAKQEIHRLITIDDNGMLQREAHYACSNCVGNFERCPICRRKISDLDKEFRAGTFDQLPLGIQKSFLSQEFGVDFVKHLISTWNPADIERLVGGGVLVPGDRALINHHGWTPAMFDQRRSGWSEIEIEELRLGRSKFLVGMEHYVSRLDNVIPIPECARAFAGGCIASLLFALMLRGARTFKSGVLRYPLIGFASGLYAISNGGVLAGTVNDLRSGHRSGSDLAGIIAAQVVGNSVWLWSPYAYRGAQIAIGKACRLFARRQATV